MRENKDIFQLWFKLLLNVSHEEFTVGVAEILAEIELADDCG